MTMTARSFLPLLLLILLASCASAWVLPCAPLKRSSSSLFVASPAQYSLDGETIRGPVTPLGNYLLVKTKDTLTATDGGILLPDQVSNETFVSCDSFELWHLIVWIPIWIVYRQPILAYIYIRNTVCKLPHFSSSSLLLLRLKNVLLRGLYWQLVQVEFIQIRPCE